MTGKIRILIIDDSRLIRTMIKSILARDPSLDVVGEAADPYEAREKIKQLNPDVVTLDVEMPRMDGLSFLEKIMSLRPMPVIMLSTLTQKGTDVTLRALELGAVDYVAKPLDQNFDTIGTELIAKIKIASTANIQPGGKAHSTNQTLKSLPAIPRCTKKLIAIGASTGGIESLYEIILRLPANCPPVVIAQHISKGFSARFALRVNKVAPVRVKEAEHGEILETGTVYMGQGGQHLTINKTPRGLVCQITEDTAEENYRPSVDRLFHSVVTAVGATAVGVILTGMGKDGAKGLMAMRAAGAVTLGQDEASAIVYGMPKAAMLIGAVERQVALCHMAREIIASCVGKPMIRKAGSHG
ncbi:Chemotaxis response regulator protein-glutamate methylesterase CheB [hydrothermal vent metagenome]|uniref:protein-glutamate methylesterase n=1 Tax=hydrothermal vent metagenome TaxID=652676 RepID=A0A3B0REK4_9ZZZZ